MYIAISLSTITPFEILFGKKPDVSHIHQFGCSAIYYEAPDTGKLGARGHLARFLGVVRNGYALHCLETRRVVFKRHVVFNNLPPVVPLTPVLTRAASPDELQNLMDDALADDGVDYARSDDSSADTDSRIDSADDDEDERVELRAMEAGGVPSRAPEVDIGENTESVFHEPALPELANAPVARRSNRLSRQPQRLTYTRPRTAAQRCLRRRQRRQQDQQLLARAEYTRRLAVGGEVNGVGDVSDDDESAKVRVIT